MLFEYDGVRYSTIGESEDQTCRGCAFVENWLGDDCNKSQEVVSCANARIIWVKSKDVAISE